MKLILFFVVLVLVAVGTLAFLGKQTGIESPLTLEQLKNLGLPDGLADKIKFTDDQSASTTVFKWQDQHGAWHYGDQPPKDTNALPVTVHAAQNVIPAIKTEAAVTTDNTDTELEISIDEQTPGQQVLQQKQAEVGTMLPSTLPVPYQKLQEILGVNITPQQEEKK